MRAVLVERATGKNLILCSVILANETPFVTEALSARERPEGLLAKEQRRRLGVGADSRKSCDERARDLNRLDQYDVDELHGVQIVLLNRVRSWHSTGRRLPLIQFGR